MKKKVLLLDMIYPGFREMLEGLNVDVVTDQFVNYDKLYENIEQFYGIIIRNEPKIDREILEKGKKSLRFVARVGSGLEHIDVEYANKCGIEVIHTPEGNANAVGEHAIGMLIALLKNFTSSFLEVKKGLWNRDLYLGQEICSKVIGIIGYGNTGKAFALKLFGFGAKVIAYDKYKKNFCDMYAQEVSLEELLKCADVISFHVPLTKETFHYANDYFFEQTKHSIILINTSRGAVVSSEALARALQNGKVWAAALDVVECETHNFKIDKQLFETEVMQYIVNHPRVLITPHIAGITLESKQRHARILFEKIRKLVG